MPFVISEDSGDSPVIHFFYGKGCPHCANAEAYLNKLEENNPLLRIYRHETYFDEEARNLFIQMLSSRGRDVEGVPTFIIGETVIVGYSFATQEEIESAIDSYKGEVNNDDLVISQTITIPAVISAAIVDAINPCAFAVLIILLTTILATKKKKRALFAGLAFSLSIFISYLLMGIGLYTAIQFSGLTHTFYVCVAVLAIMIGLFNLKDYLWYGRWFVMEVPMSWRPKLKMIIRSVTSVPGAFLVGFVVSLFLLPCTSGPYIVILGLLSKVATQKYAFFLLIFYNLIFVLPMIVITLSVYFGFTTTKKAEEIRQKKLKILHLIAGIIILVLGIGMLLSVYFGYI